jgi:TonB dependent receptor-like, beta-barrel
MNFYDEVQVVTVNAAAESSRVSAYNMTSKRGQSEFHGMVYYKHFNSGLNSRLFFDTRKTPFIQHEWQAEAGGPIIKDKTFFYASWVAQKIPLGFFKRASVPTLKMRQGDFSQFARQIVDPLTGQPFEGNRIPASRISSVSAKAQELYYPQPNIGGENEFTNNFGWTHPFHYDFFKGDWPFIRVDHNFSTKNTLYARWIQRKTPYVLDSGLPEFIWTRLRDHRQMVISDTHLFANNVVNTFRLGWNSNYIIDGEEQAGTQPIFGDEAVAAIGLQGTNRGNYHAQGFPRMQITGVTTLSTTAGGIRNDDRDFSYEDSLTWAKGRHVWKFGGEFKTFQQFDGVIPFENYGDFNFNGSLTGIGYADFLLGLPFSSTRLDPFTNRYRTNKEFGVFIQDTFKLSQRLTLDYGLRWDYYALPTFEDGLQYNWDPQTGNVVVPEAALSRIHPLYPKAIPIVTGDVIPDADMSNFRPRFAVAYRLRDNLVMRGGYGSFTERIDYFARITTGSGPFQINETYSPNVITNGVPFFSFPNPFPSNLASASIPSQSVTGFPMKTDNGTIHQYNLSIEQEMKTVGFRISYIGSRSTGLNYNLNINKPQASNIPFAQSRRPYPQFINTTFARENGAAHYDSLQMQVLRRVGSFTFNAHWTWSNNMYNFGNLEDPYNVTNQWARNNVDRRHYAAISTLWEMPWGRGRPFLSSAPAVVDSLVGGWTLQTISYFATGGYFSPAFSGSDPSNTNTSGGLPDRIAEANLSGDERTKEQWFDPSAFVIPTAGRFGNSGVNTLVGQGINAHHLSLAKRFRLSERFMFTFTGALSNLFNHPHFNNPRNNISNPNPGKFESVVPDYNPEKQTNRRVMLKLRLEF